MTLMLSLFVQRLKRFYNIRNDYVNEVDQVARHRYAQQHRKRQSCRVDASLPLSVCLCTAVYASLYF